MAVHKIGSIEVFEIDQNIDKYTRKQREQIINDLFKKEYQGKEISYLLNGQEIKAVINEVTRKNIKAKKHSGFKSENKKEIKRKQDIIFSRDFESLVDSMNYQGTYKELKVGQNKYHTSNTLWHNYIKYIYVNQEMYKVILNIRQDKNKYFIHNIKLKEVDAPTINLVYGSMINQNQLSTSSLYIIPEELEEDNQKSVQIEWISDDILKLNKEFPKEGITITAVYKMIKKEVNYYIEDAGDTKLIKKSDLPNEMIDELDEIMEEESGMDRKEFNKEKER